VTVRVATVLSAREWEPGLVAHARETASVKVVLRAFKPSDIESHAADIDVVVAGGDVTWVTPHQISSWRRLGFGVIGIYPDGDKPAASMFELGGANEVLPDSIETEALVQAIRFIAPSSGSPVGHRRGTVVAVVGPRGAPGCTEIACAHAIATSLEESTLLVDLDLGAPALAVRLGIAPRPDITDAADHVRAEGDFDQTCVRSVGELDVVTGSHRPEEGFVRGQMLAGLVDAAADGYDRVVLDVGSTPVEDWLRESVDRFILVVDASPIGIVRGAQMTSAWMGPTPQIDVNKVQPRDRSDVVAAVIRWTGLEPSAVVMDRRSVKRKVLAALPPDRSLTRSLAGIAAGP
jgi:MinD-like ATPase involved in chromosome partitioning or flagellar assembly